MNLFRTAIFYNHYGKHVNAMSSNNDKNREFRGISPDNGYTNIRIISFKKKKNAERSLQPANEKEKTIYFK